MAFVPAVAAAAAPSLFSSIAGALPAAGGIASIIGSLFGKKSSGGNPVTWQDLIPPWQQQTQMNLSQFVQQYLNQYVPGSGYTGKLTAPMTGLESQGQGILQSYLNGGGSGPLLDAADQQIQDTLAGKYTNPNTNPFIQSMKALSTQNLNDSINSARASSGARGNYFSTAAITGENLLRQKSNTDLNAQIGSVLNQERANQFNAVPIAQTLDQYKNQTLPLSQIGASQQYGGLQRTIDQANLEAQYNEYVRQQKELAGVMDTAQGTASSTQSNYVPNLVSPTTTQDNSLGSILGIISKLNLGGMNSNASIWSNLGSLFKPAGS